MHEQTLKKNHLYREAVALFLASHGLPAAPVTKNKPKGVIGPHGHISGLSEFELVASAATTGRPSEGLHAAQVAAAAQGKPHGALIISRAARPVHDSFVVMSLGTFAALVSDDPECES